MKRFCSILLFGFLLVGQVFANESTNQSAVRIFQNTTSNEEAWNSYLSKQDENDLKEGSLPIHKLAAQAYSTAQSRNLLGLVPESLRSEDIYQAIFILMNRLDQFDRISFKDLRQIGINQGLYLPDMRMFLNESKDGFEEFKDKIKNSIKTKDQNEVIPSLILGLDSYNRIKNTGYLFLVSEGFRDQSSYMRGFLTYNELPDVLTFEEFQGIGQQKGFWLPVEVNYIEKFIKKFNDKIKSLNEKAALLSNTQETNELVKALREEISSLKKENTAKPNQGVVKEVKALEAKLESLLKSQKEMEKSQQDVVSNLSSEVVGIQQRISSLSATYEDIENSLGSNEERFADVETQFELVNKSLKDLNDAFVYNQKIVIGSFVTIILILSLIFFVRKNDKKDFEQKLASTNEGIAEIRQELSVVFFDKELVSKSRISSLKVGETITLPVNTGDETYQVTVTRAGEDKISVTGIRRHENDKELSRSFNINTDVSKMIEKAARAGMLSQLFEVKAVA